VGGGRGPAGGGRGDREVQSQNKDCGEVSVGGVQDVHNNGSGKQKQKDRCNGGRMERRAQVKRLKHNP